MVPEPLGLEEDETLMTSLLFLMTSHFRAGHTLSKHIIILTRLYIFNFL